MAVVPICFKMCYKEVLGGISVVSNHAVKTECVLYNTIGDSIKSNKRVLKCASGEKPSRFQLDSSTREKQLRSLDSYFGKFKNDANQSSSRSLNNDNRSGQFKAERGDPKSKNLVSSATPEETSDPTPYPVKKAQLTQAKIDGHDGSKSDYDETSGLYVISTMASINIAIYLFEIASPIKNSDLELFSLPSLYGAKINHLILYGEWWRLLTPMFLHTGILHIGLGCWALLTFGPPVCKAYGRFTFFLIYILGGLSGNLTSFLHTPDPTVGGTGPVFAIMGAWLIYQYQNKDDIRKDVFENMYQKAIVTTALGFVLSTFGPIDDWAHFGSAFTGLAYGFVTCPTMSSSSTSSETGQDEGLTLMRRNVDPRKSLLMFSIFIIVLSSLLVIFEPPLGSLATDTLV